MPAQSDDSRLDSHASQVHQGFPRTDETFRATREQRADLVRRFLKAMDAAGRPGETRKLGSTVLQMTGQNPEHYWAAVLEDDAGHQREVLVFDDGTHGWSDAIAHSDRPRTPADEISPEHLKEALDALLAKHHVSWPDDTKN